MNRRGPKLRPIQATILTATLIDDLKGRLAKAEHRVQRLEAREDAVLEKEWRLEERERKLAAVVEEVNAATVMNEERTEALTRLEERLCGMEASLIGRERACLEREEASRNREAASSLLDTENAASIIVEAGKWAREYVQDCGELHFCEVLTEGEKAGHPSYALAYALVSAIVSDCECDEWEDDDDE